MAVLHPDAGLAARQRQSQLTKPAGSLGRLEALACWLAERSGQVCPPLPQPGIAVFAGDHGVAADGVSAFPSAVTAEMVKNFTRGGAAINVLARAIAALLEVVDVGVASPLPAELPIVHARVRAGTGNLRTEAAMSLDECRQALAIGRASARRLHAQGATLLIAGDMGIGNTTASACLVCAFTGATPEDIVGLGTGIDDARRAHKVAVVGEALARAQAAGAHDGESWLAQVGGLEIAAMAGLLLEAAALGIPALLDGFIATAAALAARAIEPAAADWWLASHRSQEQGHLRALAALGLTPLIDLELRLGEGSGAALAVPLIQMAVRLHNEMATFAEAGVSGAA